MLEDQAYGQRRTRSFKCGSNDIIERVISLTHSLDTRKQAVSAYQQQAQDSKTGLEAGRNIRGRREEEDRRRRH